MNISQKNIFRVSFKVVCVFSVALMIGYWFYKYGVEDRDIGIVDYVSIAEAESFDLPMPYICFETPVLHSKMVSLHPNLSSSAYLQYLKGHFFDKRYQNLDYEDVTVHLKDYFLNGHAVLFNGQALVNKSEDFSHNLIFSGVKEGIFLKCFEIVWNQKKDEHSNNIKRMVITYDKLKLMKDLTGTVEKPFLMFIGMHYPGQFLQGLGEKTAVTMQKTFSHLFLITKGLEFLKRRNSNKRKCMQNWKNYDKIVLSKDMESKRCLAPYHDKRYKMKQCNSEKELQTAKIDFLEIRKKYFPKPCYRISKADIEYNGGLSLGPEKEFKLIPTYPEDIKIITQSKEIDVHALIGHIGSYIGLFLGKTMICVIVGVRGVIRQTIMMGFKHPR